MDSAPPLPETLLPETLERLRALLQEQDLEQSDLLEPEELAAETALPEHTVRTLLRGGTPPADTVNERVRARLKVLSESHLARNGQRMSDLAGSISRQLGVSGVWARQVCSGDKTPSVELLHGLVRFFRVEGKEAFFTAPAPEALNRVLLPILAAQQPVPETSESAADPLAAIQDQFEDVRGIALRQARDLPEDRWKVLTATLNALLVLDESEGEQ
ncbi:hypothetical protein AB0I77_06190 [Streptomyces sp. NPDC050619]|uniref:hypothetical protein n=1 Tax=Streptomyces sp. NPDC050619 TaxID=3157214 RepID=UPI0034323273